MCGVCQCGVGDRGEAWSGTSWVRVLGYGSVGVGRGVGETVKRAKREGKERGGNEGAKWKQSAEYGGNEEIVMRARGKEDNEGEARKPTRGVRGTGWL